jgi:hypothetical protein
VGALLLGLDGSAHPAGVSHPTEFHRNVLGRSCYFRVHAFDLLDDEGVDGGDAEHSLVQVELFEPEFGIWQRFLPSLWEYLVNDESTYVVLSPLQRESRVFGREELAFAQQFIFPRSTVTRYFIETRT